MVADFVEELYNFPWRSWFLQKYRYLLACASKFQSTHELQLDILTWKSFSLVLQVSWNWSAEPLSRDSWLVNYHIVQILIFFKDLLDEVNSFWLVIVLDQLAVAWTCHGLTLLMACSWNGERSQLCTINLPDNYFEILASCLVIVHLCFDTLLDHFIDFWRPATPAANFSLICFVYFLVTLRTLCWLWYLHF